MVGLTISTGAKTTAVRPLGTRPREGVLLVAHGSRCRLAAEQLSHLADLVAQATPEAAVDLGYLELTYPAAGPVLDDLVSRGCRRIVVQPLVLLAAGHAKSDVPAVVVEARRRHPGVDVVLGRPLGVSREPVELLGKAVSAAGGAGLPLLVVARGTSDPDANADACKAARLVAEWTRAPFVHVGFSGVTGPAVAEAARVFAKLGSPKIAVAWWYLCHGRLVERGRHDLAAFSQESGVELVDAGYLGPHPGLVPLIRQRWIEAIEGGVVQPCDMCSYRAPWPGLEDRVGQPVGIGHSHLAAEHRAHGRERVRP